MEDDENDAPFESLPTLKSQRRFLEVMSLVSVVYYWFDLRINTESSLLGQSVHIGSTRYALTALWIGLIWSAWRYWQHLYQIWATVSEKIRRDFAAEMSRLANAIVRRYISNLPLDKRTEFGDARGAAEFRQAAVVRRFDFERARRFNDLGKEVAPEIPRGPLERQSHSVIHTEFDWFYDDGGSSIPFDLGIGRAQATWLWTRAAVATAARRSAVFDYAMPLIMFLFAVVSLILATIHPLAHAGAALSCASFDCFKV